MANRFFDPTPLLVVDGDLAVAADLNDVSGATEVAFDTVEGEIDAFVVGLAAGNILQADQTEASTATATTVALGVATLRHLLTGTTTVTGFTGTAGVMYTCRANAAFILTHHATNLIITQTGANITTEAGDTFDGIMITGTTCRIVNYIRASGQALVAVGTDLTATAGTTAGPTINSSTGDNVVIPSAAAGASGVVTTGAQTLDGIKLFSSELRCSDNITAYYSDKRLKTFTGKITNALDKVSQLNGYYFVENDKANEFGYNSGKTQVGVSAQEVQNILPEIIAAAPFDIGTDEDGNEYSKSGENYLTVQYDKLVPLLIEAIKELKAEIDLLKGER